MKNKKEIFIVLLIILAGVLLPEIISRSNKKLHTLGSVPSFSLMNQDSLMISDQSLLGQIYVLEFFFSTCPTICPIMKQNLIEIEQKYPNHPNISYLSITINPKHDTPEILKKHAQLSKITNPNWYFLTAPTKDPIYKLASKFNMYVDENTQAPGGFEHSGLFALIDQNGKIRCRKDSNGNPIPYYKALNYADPEGNIEDRNGKYKPGVEALVEDIQQLLNESQ
ncbi:MAG: SCO family protein [Bacteroidota bacterium]|nr:SCO family protein [Bacteroidota bacterium]